MAWSPGSVTVGARLKPMRARYSRRASRSSGLPTSAVKEAARTTDFAGTRWAAAFSVVSTTARPGSPSASAASVAMRAAEMSALGLMRS